MTVRHRFHFIVVLAYYLLPVIGAQTSFAMKVLGIVLFGYKQSYVVRAMAIYSRWKTQFSRDWESSIHFSMEKPGEPLLKACKSLILWCSVSEFVLKAP